MMGALEITDILLAFVLMFLLFASQSKANLLAKTSVTGYITNNDVRLKHIRDFLYNVKAAKLQGLERRFMDQIEAARRTQLRFLRTYLSLSFCLFSSMNQMIPAVTAATALAFYWYTGHQLDAGTVFPALALFELMYQPAGKLSISVTRQFSVVPSLRRITSVLTAEEDRERTSHMPVNREHAIEMDNLEVIYPGLQDGAQETIASGNAFLLGPLSVDIPQRRLTMIVGPVGNILRNITHLIHTAVLTFSI